MDSKVFEFSWTVGPETMIAVLALLISFFALGWNVYRDIVLKPKFRVQVAIMRIHDPITGSSPPFIQVSGLNLGPRSNRAGMVFARGSFIDRRVLRKEKATAYIHADYQHPATSPKEIRDKQIEVGETISYAFPYDTKSFLKEKFVSVGLADGYGRIHWCKKSQLRSVRKKFIDDVGGGKST